VQSPRTPCGAVYFEHAHSKRRGLAFVQPVRQHAFGATGALSTLDMFSSPGGPKITHPTVLQEVPGSFPGSSKKFYV